jgi:hypothetical protein
MVWQVKHLPGMLVALVVTAMATGASAGTWFAGPYSFSDELGGFLIRNVSGSGSKYDPIVIDQEMLSASPVTLVVRVTIELKAFGAPGSTGMIHMRMRSLNNSGIAWTEYEFELQTRLGEPSVFGDGISFDQRRSDPDNRSSDLFRIHDTDFEPFDRLLFTKGSVDPNQTAEFSFFITDFTPRWIFYIRQDPRIPLS